MLPVHHTQSATAECSRAGPGHYASKPLTVPVHCQEYIFVSHLLVYYIQPMLVHTIFIRIGFQRGGWGLHNHTQLSLEADLSVIEH